MTAKIGQNGLVITGKPFFLVRYRPLLLIMGQQYGNWRVLLRVTRKFPKSLHMKIIEFQLSEKQYINASMVLLSRRPATWIMPIMLILLILVFYNPGMSSVPSVITFLMVYFGIYTVITPLSLYTRAKKMYQEPSVGAKEKVQIEFHENMFVAHAETSFLQSSWSGIYKVIVTKNWVFIWLNPIHPTPIPKAAIWEGELLRLREILDANKIKHNFEY
jgi:hypothetical protein